jgi:hypothetical protein
MQSRRARVGFVVVLALATVLVAGCSLAFDFKCFEGECTTAATSGSTTGQGGGASSSASVAASTSVSSVSSASGTGGAGSAWCPTGMVCIDVPNLPFHDARSTAQEGSTFWNVYTTSMCDSSNESGPEIVYRLHLPATGGKLSATLNLADMMKPTDIDMMLLTALDPTTCVFRNDYQMVDFPASGVMYVVADTFVDGLGVHSGSYSIDISFVAN